MYWAYILGIAISLYLISSLRVLRQYERGVVFLLGNSTRCAGQGSRTSSLPSSRWRVDPCAQ
jgi:regulator of protease activity HflC (stomatin/prohibitin superfamily)